MSVVSAPLKTGSVKKAWYRSIYAQVIIAIVGGIALGHFFPEWGQQMKPLSDGFISLIKMVIGPVIFCTIVHGIAGSDNIKQVGSTGIKALGYFMAMTIFAMVIGLAVVNIQKPGVGMNIGETLHEKEYVAAEQTTTTSQQAKAPQGTVAFLLGIIPKTLSSAFAEGNILQVLFVSLLCAIALAGMGESRKPIVNAIEQLSTMFFRIVGMVVKLAPLGAFGAMSYTIGEHGVGSLLKLMSLMLGFYITCFVFIFVVLGIIMKFVGLPLWAFLKYIKDEIVIVLGTCSSETVLPNMIEKLTRLGCQKSLVGVVLPTGYSFNLDGTAIYLTMAAVFIAQATNTPLNLIDQLGLLALMIVTSKGAAAVIGAAFIVLTATLSSMNIMSPALLTIALAQVFAIDRFMAEARAVTNLIGNGVATLFIAKWEKALDIETAKKVLSEK